MPSSLRTAVGLGDRADVRSFRLLGRLKPGATREQVEEDAARVLREIRPARTPAVQGVPGLEMRAGVASLAEVLTGPVRPVLAALLSAAFLVLLVACGNIASLFLGRAVGQRRNLAVRLALGATPWRIARGVFAESLVLAAAASAAGAWIGFALVRLFVGAAAGAFPRLDAVAVDAPVFAAAASRSTRTGARRSRS
jgi:putative ABC transport system permease protein